MGAEGRSLGGVEGRGATWLNIVQSGQWTAAQTYRGAHKTCDSPRTCQR